MTGNDDVELESEDFVEHGDPFHRTGAIAVVRHRHGRLLPCDGDVVQIAISAEIDVIIHQRC